MRKPLPTFNQWLAENGDGTKGDGFDAFVDVVQRTLETGALPHYDETARSLLRIYSGIAIAVIETCNIERGKHGRTPADIVQLLPRALAMCAMYALASISKDDTDAADYRMMAKVLTEDFRFAAKECADQIGASHD